MLPTPMPAALEQLLAILDLEDLEVNLFRGRSPREKRLRVFGGQVAGQALVAACRTVERGRVHSLHAYFLRPGDVRAPIIYQVDRLRDGHTFATRRVVAIQHGQAIFAFSASFQPEENGPDHQTAMPPAPDPEGLPPYLERIEPFLPRMPPHMRAWLTRDRPIEFRPVDEPDPFGERTRPPRHMTWVRTNGALPDDPVIHQVIVAYASDMSLLDTAAMPHGIAWNDPTYMMASLDHALWFHRSFRADDWLLYATESPSAHGARGFAIGHFYTRTGQLVASVAQEGLIRPLPPTTR